MSCMSQCKKPIEVVNTEKPKVSEEKSNKNESVETPVLEIVYQRN